MPVATGRKKAGGRGAAHSGGARPGGRRRAGAGLDRGLDVPLFEQLAKRIEDLIGAGTLSAGDQVPSVRQARVQFGVSAATVLEAYRLLEARGLIRARPQSGYYVRQAGGRACAAPARTRPRMKSVLLEPPEPMLVRLKAATPDASLLPVAALGRLASRVYREHPEVVAEYASAQGHEGLRREIARRMIDAGCTVSPDEVLVTAGATEAISLALLALTARGDTVIVESPGYHGLLDALRARGVRALPVSSCSVDGPCIDSIEKALNQQKVSAIVLMANFSNPLGGLMPDEHKKRLVALAGAHGVPIIEDDVYGELGFDEPRPSAVRSFDDGSTVVYCSSFSKVLGPGLRVGWCVPGARMEELQRLKIDLNVASPVAMQMVVAEFLGGGGYDKHLRGLRRHYRMQVAAFTDAVMASFPEGTRIAQPRGGHVLWVEMPEGVDSMVLLERAMKRGITFAPGPLFAPDDSYRNCLRLNCAVVWRREIAEAIATIGMLAREGGGEREAGRAMAL